MHARREFVSKRFVNIAFFGCRRRERSFSFCNDKYVLRPRVYNVTRSSIFMADASSPSDRIDCRHGVRREIFFRNGLFLKYNPFL